MSSSYFAKQALLDNGWANNVLIIVSDHGQIESTTIDAEQSLFQYREALAQLTSGA